MIPAVVSVSVRFRAVPKGVTGGRPGGGT
jgi:hypothetical protein